MEISHAIEECWTTSDDYYYFVVVVVAVTVTVIELFSNQTMYLFSCVIKSISETNLYIKYVVLFVL